MREHSEIVELQTKLECALFLRSLGLCIIPLDWPHGPGTGKAPALKRWMPYQTVRSTEAEIRGWWARNPNFNIGVPTGEVSGFDVIDADRPEAVEKIVAELPFTPFQVITAKGRHFYYRNTGLRLKNSVKIGGMAVDRRSFGGFVVGPGSVHCTGHIYGTVEPLTEALLKEVPPLDPKWLAEERKYVDAQILASDVDPEIRAAAWLAKIPGAVSGQGGSNVTFRCACRLIHPAPRGFGISSDRALKLLMVWNAKCEPEWSIKELRHKVEDAVKAMGSRRGDIQQVLGERK